MVSTHQLRFVGFDTITKADRDLICEAADEIDALRKAADGVLKTYMPMFPDSRAVDDCLVELAKVRAGV